MHTRLGVKKQKRKQKDRATDAAGSETKSVVGCLVDFLLTSTTMIIRPKGIAVYYIPYIFFFFDFVCDKKILFCCDESAKDEKISHHIPSM